MAVSVTTVPANRLDRYARVLNLLYDRTSAIDVDEMLRIADVDVDGLDPLIRGLQIRARDRHGVAITDLPSVATPDGRHADYPHWPGRHFGCPACEARCHCTGQQGHEPCVYEGTHDPGASPRPLSEVQLRLTNRGRAWVTRNPRNKLVRTMVGYPRTFRVADALRVAGEDRSEVRALVADGYATLHYAGDLTETTFGGTTTSSSYVFNHARDFALLPTDKARRVVPTGEGT